MADPTILNWRRIGRSQLSRGRSPGRGASGLLLGAVILFGAVACGGAGSGEAQTGPGASAGGQGAVGAGGQGGQGGLGTAGGGAQVEPIAEVTANDANGVPLRLGETVTVRGVVTVPSDVMSFENHEIYLQDETGGIGVYEANLQSFTTRLGDDIEVTGLLGQYAGKAELTLPRVVTHGSDSPLPAPAETTTADLCAGGELLESQLVAFRSVTVVGGEPWPTVNQEGNANLVVDDGSGPCALRIDHQTELNGSTAPAGPFDVVGVNKQYDLTAPYDSGYALQPRYRSDVTAP